MERQKSLLTNASLGAAALNNSRSTINVKSATVVLQNCLSRGDQKSSPFCVTTEVKIDYLQPIVTFSASTDNNRKIIPLRG